MADLLQGVEAVIRAACDKPELGSVAALARELGLERQAIYRWRSTLGQVPVEHVIPVERLTGVSRTVQRPDVYPPEPGLVPEIGDDTAAEQQKSQ